MSVYDRVKNARPGRAAFNLSYEKKLTCDMGQLIPIMCDEVVPGDTFKIGVEAVIRFQPLVSPVLHEINAFFHYFFVPYRLLWADWEKFITGDVDGEDASVLPRWAPSGGGSGAAAAGTLWDYFGFPVGVDPIGARPMAFPLYAYNAVYNNYYRDENQVAEMALDEEGLNYGPLLRAWEKDYFTSALPWQQRGTAPALPISGSSSAVWAVAPGLDYPAPNDANVFTMEGNSVSQVGRNQNTVNVLEGGSVVQSELNTNTVDLSVASTFDVADLRLAFQLQKWQERNARAGVRYTEFLAAHFGVSPRDERLQRPEYIGGTRMPVMVSEVLQTSSTDATTPQGNMAGHGLSAGRDFCASYRAEEFGLILGIMSVMPRTAYDQGINRQWLRTTRFDFYTPEFAHLSEQAVIRAEIFCNGVSNDNNTIFGYQGRFNEMRSKQSMLCGLMRSDAAGSLDFWHLGRHFATYPELDQSFIECDPAETKRIFADEDAPGLIVNIANIIKAIRPLPMDPDPGLIDHM